MVAAAAAALVAVSVGVSPAVADTGPRLDVAPADLAASLTCSAGIDNATQDPVLLIPGTTLTADVNFDWNYERAFAAVGRSYCAVTLPNHGMSDIQVSAEYVVSALRTMADRAGRHVDVVGFSQGGMITRWALKFWPDTRGDVDDVIGIDPSNHGTLDAFAICATGCAPSIWQQRTGSRFLATLNAGRETYSGINYTQVYSVQDEVVVPNLPPDASSSLYTGPGRISNIAVQQICPAHVADHLMMGTIDPVAYAVVIDALDHAGPADAARIDRAVCSAPLMPGVDPVALPANELRFNSQVATSLAGAPHVAVEPPLQPYARS
ncbi:lipase [Pseudonocardia sp. K10HN5]|uniref:Lipase n=1 Tax=Pseudonocardia acidicola TaxID=2724939 RepID=A0ABX1S751_9PSEU|nr:lipase [Pseudonocardia acidicola]